MAKKKEDERPLHERLPPVTFTPMGAEDKQKDQGNLLAAKQQPAFPMAGGLISHCLSKRGERILLDFTQAGVAVKFDVDGIWVGVDPYDRQTGDGMLMVFKKIASLNPQERRARQDGRFGAEWHGIKYICHFTSQGVQTGERVMIKLVPKKAKFETIEDLGMRPKMRERYKSLVDSDQGFVILSTPPGQGLTTLWRIGINTADRFVRDFISLEDKNNPEEEIINVGPVFYDKAAGQTPASILPKLLLKQPDVFVVPELNDPESLKMLCEQVNKHHKMVITRLHAKEAVEALLRLLMAKPPVKEFAAAISVVLNGRLIRKLCDKCKQPFQPNPQMLQKLGIPPGRVQTLYREFQPPPPEQRVDEKGRPIEIEICKECGGVGYLGRTSIYELLEVSDPVRAALQQQPTVDALRKAAKASGHRTLQEEGIALVALGVTSLNELQRVLKQ